MRTDMHKLVDTGHSADDGKVVDVHVPGQLHHIGDDAVAAHLTVVRHVHIFHQEVAISHHGVFFQVCSAVDGHIFPDQVSAADDEARILAGILEVLGLRSYHGVAEDAVFVAQGGIPVYGDGCDQVIAAPHLHLGPDITPGPNDAIIANLGTWVHDSGWVDLTHLFFSCIMAINSPSATLSLPTNASPRILERVRLSDITFISKRSVSPGRTGFRNLTLSMEAK